jgi:hypothetical protein
MIGLAAVRCLIWLLTLFSGIAQARSLLRRVLLVVDKQTLEVEHIAAAGLLSRRWTPVAKELWDEWLK